MLSYKPQRPLFILWMALTLTTTTCKPSTAAEDLITATTSDPSIKTAAAETTNCGINGNTDTICSPKTGETWKNGTWYPITWNAMYPTYVSSPTLDIYIYFVQNYQNILIKTLTDVSTAKGTVPVLVDDTWRLNPSAQTYETVVYVLPSGANPEKEMNNRFSDYPPPVHNIVAQVALTPPVTALPSNTSSVISSSTVISPPTNQIPITPFQSPSSVPPHLSKSEQDAKQQQQRQDSHTLQPGIIAAVVLACFAVLGACIAVFWVMRHSRRRKLVYGEKGHLVAVNSAASSSMFPMNNVDGGSREKLHHQNGSFISVTNPSSVRHSNFSSDAMVMPSPLLMTGNSTARLLGTAHKGSEQGSLKSHTTPNTPNPLDHKQQSFGFMSVPSLPFMENNNNSNSGGNQVYMMGGADNNRPQSTASFSNVSSRSEPPLTSTDALLIADTFRQKMRRPDWIKQQQAQSQEDKDEEEEDKRRQLSETLLKTELEAEGTLMKKVGKRAHLLPATYQKQHNNASSK